MMKNGKAAGGAVELSLFDAFGEALHPSLVLSSVGRPATRQPQERLWYGINYRPNGRKSYYVHTAATTRAVSKADYTRALRQGARHDSAAYLQAKEDVQWLDDFYKRYGTLPDDGEAGTRLVRRTIENARLRGLEANVRDWEKVRRLMQERTSRHQAILRGLEEEDAYFADKEEDVHPEELPVEQRIRLFAGWLGGNSGILTRIYESPRRGHASLFGDFKDFLHSTDKAKSSAMVEAVYGKPSKAFMYEVHLERLVRDFIDSGFEKMPSRETVARARELAAQYKASGGKDASQKESPDKATRQQRVPEGEEAAALPASEVALRDQLIGMLRGSGIEVITDIAESQDVLDSSKNVRLSSKSKKAPRTASLHSSEEDEDHSTVVLSADGAKILKNLDNLANEYTFFKNNRPKTFIGDVARVLGASRKGSSSEYASFKTVNGNYITIRLANHNAKASSFDNKDEIDGISIVVSPRPNQKMTNDGKAHVVEYYYNSLKIGRAQGKPLAQIITSIKQSLYSGEYKDTTGLAKREELNEENSRIKFFKMPNGDAYGFTSGGRIYIDPRIATAETPLHEYTHLWADAIRKLNPKEWQNIVGLLKGTWAWEHVEKSYPELKSDDEIADEALAHFSGRRGAENARKAMEEAGRQQRPAQKNGNGGLMGAAQEGLKRLQEALSKFWKDVCDLLHIHFTTAEEVADRVMADLLRGFDPRKVAQSDELREDMAADNMRPVKSETDPKLRVTSLPSDTAIPFKSYDGEDGQVTIEDARKAINGLGGGYPTYDGHMLTSSKDTRHKLVNILITGKDNNDLRVALSHVSEILSNSVLIEEHRDRIKVDGVRKAENPSDPNIEKVQVYYGSVAINGTQYRVKTTVPVFAAGNNRVRGYEIGNMELSSPTPTASSQGVGRLRNNSISLAKLLKNIEFSYETGKKLLDEINKNSNVGKAARQHRPAQTERESGLREQRADDSAPTVKETASLPASEVALRDQLISMLRGSGIEVITDVEEGQRVLDWANGQKDKNDAERLIDKRIAELRRKDEQSHNPGKGSLSVPPAETGNPQSKTGTEGVASNAKLRDLDEQTKEIARNLAIFISDESNWKDIDANNFVQKLATSLGKSDFGQVSVYTDYSEQGQRVTIRVSDHRGNARNIILDGMKSDMGISLVIFNDAETSDKNIRFKGKNSEKFDVVEYEYDHPDAERLRKIAKGLFAAVDRGEYIDLAGRDDYNDTAKHRRNVREMRGWHGSGQDFDLFDSSHMGDGEGAQAHGWGNYIALSKDTARKYAVMSGNTYKTLYRGREISYFGNDNVPATKSDAAAAAQVYAQTTGRKNDGKLTFDLPDVDELISGCDKSISYLENDYKQRFPQYTSYADNQIKKYEAARKYYKAHGVDGLSLEPQRIIYNVDIPEDNGGNYLEQNKTIEELNRPDMADRINKAIDNYLGATDFYNSWQLTGQQNRAEAVRLIMGSHPGMSRNEAEKKYSELLSKAGVVGMHYDGKVDGECYVIFNDDDVKITDKVRFFRGRHGAAYGFTSGGRIYIDPRIATAETPLHEYTHLWAEALRKGNPKEWENVVGLMKREKVVWDEVCRNYPELKTDDDIADEVLATYSGREGARKLREKMELLKREGKDTSMLSRIREAIKRFWSAVTDMFHVHFDRKEDIPDQILRDMLNGVNPSLALENARMKLSNDFFNKRLKEIVANPVGISHEIPMGKPGKFLIDGDVIDVDMVFDYDRIMMKAKATYKNSHPFDILDVEDLPLAINHPIAVFEKSLEPNSGISILTELQKDGNNFLAVLNTEIRNHKGGGRLVVDNVTTLYPKDCKGIVYWFYQKYASNIDKDKALHFISAVPAHSGTKIKKGELKLAAKVINDFDLNVKKQENLKKRDIIYEDYIKKGDFLKAKEMIRDAAFRAGYFYPDYSEREGGAPSSQTEVKDFANLRALRESMDEFGDGVNLYGVINGVSLLDDFAVFHPEKAGFTGRSGIETGEILRRLRNGKGGPDTEISTFRVVPNFVKGEHLMNGDWIALSRTYCEEMGMSKYGEGNFHIIEEKVPIKYVWQSGDDAREFGFDDGRENVSSNVRNNRKLLEITYDDKGILIPLSKRFDGSSDDMRFQRAPTALASSPLSDPAPLKAMSSPSPSMEKSVSRAERVCALTQEEKSVLKEPSKIDEYSKDIHDAFLASGRMSGGKLSENIRLHRRLFQSIAPQEAELAANKLFVGHKLRVYESELASRKAAARKYGLGGAGTSLEAIGGMFRDMNSDESLGHLFDSVMPVCRLFGAQIALTGRFSRTLGESAYDGTLTFSRDHLLQSGVSNQEKASTILHEMTHNATQYAIYAYEHRDSDRPVRRNGPTGRELWASFTEGQQQAVETLFSVYDTIRNDKESFPGLFGGKQYGLTNVHEMVAEIFSNPEFRSQAEKKNLWEEIVDAIKRFFTSGSLFGRQTMSARPWRRPWATFWSIRTSKPTAPSPRRRRVPVPTPSSSASREPAHLTM